MTETDEKEVNASELTEAPTTTVIMTNSVTLENTTDPTTSFSRTESFRRRFSKQSATLEESEVKTPSFDVTCEEDDKEDLDRKNSRKLQRENAFCGDDDTKLRPPSIADVQRHSWSKSKSLSRESSTATDRSGSDLNIFLYDTLHKSMEDREKLLEFEKTLTDLINDTSRQSIKISLETSYLRMLLHRCAAIFGLDHNVTNSGVDVVVNKSEKTRLPDFDFSSLIEHDIFSDDYKVRNRSSEMYRPLQHVHSCQGQLQYYDQDHYGSSASLANQHGSPQMMVRRAQSFDVPPQYYPSQQPQFYQPNGQLIYPNPEQPQQQRYRQNWQNVPQRSFDVGYHGQYQSYGPQYPIEKRNVRQRRPLPDIQSLANMKIGHFSVEQASKKPPAPIYQPAQPMQPMQPIYVNPDYQPPHGHSAPSSCVIQPPQAHYYPQAPPVYVTPTQYNLSPKQGRVCYMMTPVRIIPYTAFQPTSHQMEYHNSYINTSMDGGYGSMNQETSREPEPEETAAPSTTAPSTAAPSTEVEAETKTECDKNSPKA